MKIVLLSGFTSSSIFDQSGGNFENDPDHQDYAFMGGANFRSQFDDADVVIATWGPEKSPIVIRCPEDVEVQGAVWAHLKHPRMVPSITPQDWRRASFPEESNEAS